MERLFDLDWQLIADSALTAINIFILFIVASYLFFNPVREFLQARQKRIKKDLATAETEKKSALDMKAEYEAKLKEVNKEAEEILSSARKKATKNETKIIDDAKAEAARIIQQARKEAELEKKRVADEMKKEMVAIASAMAGKVVAASIDTTVQDSLIDETIKEMGDGTWLS
ncbi:MAG: F0F1 ATP synthase subunit B [Lachnospiraceae bacterium]|nr:F0F1 ATP synthase subunit B [Lachnospiraceae bacterium]